MEIFTIGHSNYSIERFVGMLRLYHINCVVDIRGTPYSKYNIQYNKETIRQTLTQRGYLYIYMGKEFAAQREDKSLYTNEGYADFEKVVKDKDFLSGIERLREGCRKGYRIALMGAKQEPINCHRCILLGRALSEAGFEVRHILDDSSLTTNQQLEERLLEKYCNTREQLTFDMFMGTEPSREERLRDCYRKSNKEIGFRVENINRK